MPVASFRSGSFLPGQATRPPANPIQSAELQALPVKIQPPPPPTLQPMVW